MPQLVGVDVRERLLELAAKEGTPVERLLARLRAIGVTALDLDERDRPERLNFRGPRYRGGVAIDYAQATPIAEALRRIQEEVRVVDLYVRLRLAAADLALVATAANQLAHHRPSPRLA